MMLGGILLEGMQLRERLRICPEHSGIWTGKIGPDLAQLNFGYH
jgi:hypothetical protein